MVVTLHSEIRNNAVCDNNMTHVNKTRCFSKQRKSQLNINKQIKKVKLFKTFTTMGCVIFCGSIFACNLMGYGLYKFADWIGF